MRIAAREYQLHRREKALVENLLLIGDELAHAVGDLNRTPLQFDNADGDAVQVEDDVRPALEAAAQSHFLGEGEVVFVNALRIPLHKMHRVVRFSGGDLNRDAVAQELIRAQAGLIQRDSGGVHGGHQVLQGGGNVRLGIVAPLQICPKQVRLDATVVRALVPLAEVTVAEAIGPGLVREQGDDAVLRLAFGAWDFRHDTGISCDFIEHRTLEPSASTGRYDLSTLLPEPFGPANIRILGVAALNGSSTSCRA